jgi:hypothetical protein
LKQYPSAIASLLFSSSRTTMCQILKGDQRILHYAMALVAVDISYKSYPA